MINYVFNLFSADGTGDYLKLCEKPIKIDIEHYSGDKLYKEKFELPMKGINCIINTSDYVRMEQKKIKKIRTNKINKW